MPKQAGHSFTQSEPTDRTATALRGDAGSSPALVLHCAGKLTT